jgi:hypothetical protein
MQKKILSNLELKKSICHKSILSRRSGSVVEHTLGKGEVEGSIPSYGTIFERFNFHV